MTTAAPDTDQLKALDEDCARAWRSYRERLQDLTGEAYELAERDSWKVLQNELRRLERRRSLLTAPTPQSA